MSKLCELTGKRPQTGHNVSHANNKTKRRFFPNLKKVSFKSEKLNRDIRIKICTRAIKAVVQILNEYRDWETDRKSTRLNSSH